MKYRKYHVVALNNVKADLLDLFVPSETNQVSSYGHDRSSTAAYLVEKGIEEPERLLACLIARIIEERNDSSKGRCGSGGARNGSPKTLNYYLEVGTQS